MSSPPRDKQGRFTAEGSSGNDRKKSPSKAKSKPKPKQKGAKSNANQKPMVSSADRAVADSDHGQTILTPSGREPIDPQAGSDERQRAYTEQRTTGNRQKLGVMAEQYPTGGLEDRDPRDKLMSLKMALADEKGVTPYGKMSWSDEVGQYLLKKEQAVKYARFQEWFARHYDRMDDAGKEVARELFPRFFEERNRKLKENIKLLEDLASLRINGVRSSRDLALKYAAENGLLNLDQVTSILHPERTANTGPSFQAGLFNPDRYFGNRNEADAAAFSGFGYGSGSTGMKDILPESQFGVAKAVIGRNPDVRQRNMDTIGTFL